MTESAGSRRDGITSLFDAARVNGAAYLLAIVALGHATIAELVEVTGDERHTVGRYLRRLESRGLLIRTQDGGRSGHEKWFPTPRALALLGIGVPTKEVFLPSPSSSSDQLPDQSIALVDQSVDLEEEERRKKKCHHLIRHYSITGKMAQTIINDTWMTPERLVAWMLKAYAMQQHGFHFRSSPEAYALACLTKHHEPPADYLYQAPQIIDLELRWALHDDEAAPDEEDDTDDA